MAGPLHGLRVLDFTTLLPGPYATMLLADLGAAVVRVEAPNRPDPVRFTPPFDGDSSAWHQVLNRNKQSLSLDLKQPAAVAVVHRLVADFDIVIEQFRPGVMDRLGVGYAALSARNPRLIYCALTGYGQDGPYRDRAGHDINYLALSGVASYAGRAAGGPVPLPVQVADIGGGSLLAVIGILAAVHARSQTGRGQFVDVSMFDGALAWNALGVAHTVVGGTSPAPEATPLNGGHFYDYYLTADGRYLAVGSLEPKFWQGFCEALGRPDLISRGYRLEAEAQQALKAEIAATIATRTFAAWSTLFGALDVCVEPVLTTAEAIDHPQTRARGMIVAVPKADGSHQPQVAHPIHFSDAAPVYRHVGGVAGADGDALLTAAGISADEIAALRAAGALG